MKESRRTRAREVLLLTDDEQVLRIALPSQTDATGVLVQLVGGGLERVALRGLPAGLRMYVNDEFLLAEELGWNGAATSLVRRAGVEVHGPACIVRERGSSLLSLTRADLAHLARALGRDLPRRAQAPSARLLARLRGSAGEDAREPAHDAPTHMGPGPRQLELELGPLDDIPF